MTRSRSIARWMTYALTFTSGLDIRNGLRCGGGQVFGPLRRHQHIVLDADADIPIMLGNVVSRTNVGAGLDRQHHTGGKLLRLALYLIEPCIVHVHAKPMSGAMHIEL